MGETTTDASQRDIAALLRDTRVIQEALGRAGREALLRHKQLGLSVPIWRNGHTEWIPPEEIDTLLAQYEGATSSQVAPDAPGEQ